MRLRLNPGSPSTFSSERSFDPPIGQHWDPAEQVRGYYIDFSSKAYAPRWPPDWLGPVDKQLHVATAQWGFGAYERYLNGEGEAWLEAARGAADHLLELQHDSGGQDGGWRHLFPLSHTFRLDPPWLSGMAQGEGASLLVRLFLETGEERYAEAALRALKPMNVPVPEGGTLAFLDGLPFVEEYPTDPPSCVLNGAIFALWGCYDVYRGLADTGPSDLFESFLGALATSMPRYDTGYWSRYDLFPHPLPNIASPAYHLLHIKQLRVLARIAPRPEFDAALSRFEAYRASRLRRYRALSQKIAFRLVVPRNSMLAHRLPWNQHPRAREAAGPLP